MATTPTEFDFSTGDFGAFLRNVGGLNFMYRGQMLKALASEDKEIFKLGEIFKEINEREINEDIRLTSPAFRQGFLTLFIMNGGDLEQFSTE